MQRHYFLKKTIAAPKYWQGIIFLIILFVFFVSSGYAAEYYNIYLKDGRTLKDYNLYKSKKDPSILIAKKKGMRIELKKISIDSYKPISKKNRSSFHYSSSLSPYQYTYKQLLDTDIKTLYEMHQEMYKTIEPLRNKQTKILMASDGYKRMTSRGYKQLESKINTYSEFFDYISRAITVKRGIEAGIKLDNGDWSSASDIESLIEDKVEMDMLDY